YTWLEDLPVGCPIANRNRAEIENLIGFFVNTLVMRTDVSGEPSFSEVLARVREVSLEAFAHQDLPFEKLVEELQPERSLSHTPLFQVLFHLQNALTERLQLSGLIVSHFAIPDHTAKFDLSVTITETENALRAGFNYNADLFDRSTIERMASHFETLLNSIAAEPDERISRLALLNPNERVLLTDTWDDNERRSPAEENIPEVFEQ